MDFFEIKVKPLKNGTLEIYPDFITGRPKDILFKGHSFYAIWDEENLRWSTDILDVQRIVDKEIYKKRETMKDIDRPISLKTLNNFSSGMWTDFITYCSKMPDSKPILNQKIFFANDSPKREDYSSIKLNYVLEEGPIDNYIELVSTLYSNKEREKFEWAIGSIIAGDSTRIQKFEVFFGPPGCGKGTILKIIENMFGGYQKTVDISSLTTKSDQFSTEQFSEAPLVGLQMDGDLSKIENNTILNSIVSHENIQINAKFKSKFTFKSNCFMFMASNKPVMITDAYSGIARRLIDIRPTGEKINGKKYTELMKGIEFEIGAIAYHCLKVYKELGEYYYDKYVPLDMMFRTDYFFNFVEDNFNFSPANIINELDLLKPKYKQTACYGHFGRNDLDLPWEKLDKVDALKKFI